MDALVKVENTYTKSLDDMTPREIVEALDKYVIGQDDAKKTIAIAIRNRVPPPSAWSAL